MPIHQSKDIYGYYYQYGTRGKKYYYDINNINSKKRAYNKVIRQIRAMFANGYKGY